MRSRTPSIVVVLFLSAITPILLAPGECPCPDCHDEWYEWVDGGEVLHLVIEDLEPGDFYRVTLEPLDDDADLAVSSTADLDRAECVSDRQGTLWEACHARAGSRGELHVFVEAVHGDTEVLVQLGEGGGRRR